MILFEKMGKVSVLAADVCLVSPALVQGRQNRQVWQLLSCFHKRRQLFLRKEIHFYAHSNQYSRIIDISDTLRSDVWIKQFLETVRYNR